MHANLELNTWNSSQSCHRCQVNTHYRIYPGKWNLSVRLPKTETMRKKQLAQYLILRYYFEGVLNLLRYCCTYPSPVPFLRRLRENKLREFLAYGLSSCPITFFFMLDLIFENLYSFTNWHELKNLRT